jgi:hypothetical protein
VPIPNPEPTPGTDPVEPITPPGPVTDPSPIPTPAPDPGTGSTAPGGIPAWLGLGVGLFIVGGTAELLYKINPNAGYGFALIVVLGYAATGGNLGAVEAFMKDIGAIGQ